jgi:hypothetical protein
MKLATAKKLDEVKPISFEKLASDTYSALVDHGFFMIEVPGFPVSS